MMILCMLPFGKSTSEMKEENIRYSVHLKIIKQHVLLEGVFVYIMFFKEHSGLDAT